MTHTFAVVEWFNYRKELSAGFLEGFDDLKEAIDYAYERAFKDIGAYMSNDTGIVITEDQITDRNGPGKTRSPYAKKTVVGFGGRYPDGYMTNFYCVVPWFDGVMNDWNCFKSEDYWDEKYDGQWYPIYSR